MVMVPADLHYTQLRSARKPNRRNWKNLLVSKPMKLSLMKASLEYPADGYFGTRVS